MAEQTDNLMTVSSIDRPTEDNNQGKEGIRLRRLCTWFGIITALTALALLIASRQGNRGIQTALIIAMPAEALGMVLVIDRQVHRPLMKMAHGMKEKEVIPPSGAEELRIVTRTYNRIAEEHRETTERLTYEAMHDALTGLLNRKAYEVFYRDTDLEHAAALMIDVDDFKSINDTYGHDMGDRILRRVAEVLVHSFRSVDQIYRIGGDEFAVIMTRANSSMRDVVLDKINRANHVLLQGQGDLPPASLSVGVAFCDRKNPQGDLLKDADSALYRVKQAGRCGCAVY